MDWTRDGGLLAWLRDKRGGCVNGVECRLWGTRGNVMSKGAYALLLQTAWSLDPAHHGALPSICRLTRR